MSGNEVETEVERQLAIIRDGAVELYGEEELRPKLEVSVREGRPLRVKLGMDPSSPDLHLGHTVVLMKLKRFLELGHTPIFLIGDFTARIGDPSGKKKTRPPLDEAQVRENAETYVDQVSKILDVSRVEIRFNNEWMSEMSPGDMVIRLCSTVHRGAACSSATTSPSATPMASRSSPTSSSIPSCRATTRWRSRPMWSSVEPIRPSICSPAREIQSSLRPVPPGGSSPIRCSSGPMASRRCRRVWATASAITDTAGGHVRQDHEPARRPHERNYFDHALGTVSGMTDRDPLSSAFAGG